MTELLTVYVRLLDALNAFYRGVDDPLKLIATPEQVAHQLDLRKSWNGDRAQQELLVPHVRVIRLAPDDATIADTSVYRTVWYLHTGSQSPAVVKPVRLLEHFHRDQAGAWRFVEGLTVAADVDVPDTIIPDVAQKP